MLRTSVSTAPYNTPRRLRHSQRPGGFADYRLDNVTDTLDPLRGLLERLK